MAYSKRSKTDKEKKLICDQAATCTKYMTNACLHQRPHKMYDGYCMRTACGIDGKGKCVKVKEDKTK
jgi:hypothetical protein